MDLLDALARESESFSRAAWAMDLDAAVPTCPGWTGADLVWHLTEAQHFWASIVDGRLADPEGVVERPRPDPAELVAAFDRDSARLVSALGNVDFQEPLWSWSSLGGTAAWVLRRQTHEALIHRIDAESVVGSIGPVDAELAIDGVDEVLRVMLDANDLPDWAGFEPIDRFANVRAAAGSWGLELGLLVGTSPDSGKTYQSPAIRLLDGVVGDPDVSIEGPPDALDLWLWGRGAIDRIALNGDPALAHFVREAARDGTQ